MHDILKERVWRRIQALPQEQVYQVLDYIEFLEAKYAREKAHEPDVLQKFAERVEDSLRMRSVAPKVISGTVGLLGTARRVMRTVSDAGRDILGPPVGQDTTGSRPPNGRTNASSPVTRTPTTGRASDTPPSPGQPPVAGPSGGAPSPGQPPVTGPPGGAPSPGRPPVTGPSGGAPSPNAENDDTT